MNYSRIQQAARDTGASCLVWSTKLSTRDREALDSDEAEQRAAFGGDVVFDAGTVSARFNLRAADYWDVGGLHPRPITNAYHKLNVKLFQLLAEKRCWQHANAQNTIDER